MSKAFTSEEAELPPDVHARPPPVEPRPLDDATREKMTREGVVRIYAHVTLQSETDAPEYWLVAPNEAEPSRGRLSIDSPLGRALLGKREGDEVTFARPKGAIDYEVVSVRY
jgi:transcription elongation GreA/GreB family factor